MEISVGQIVQAKLDIVVDNEVLIAQGEQGEITEITKAPSSLLRSYMTVTIDGEQYLFAEDHLEELFTIDFLSSVEKTDAGEA